MIYSLGACPTNQHFTNFRQCGFVGCVDLRLWAKANRYRYRLEESYKAEDSQHVKGDGRWFVEIVCQNGLIYPKGGTTLLAYATRGVKRHIAGLGPDIQHHQTDGEAEVFKFPVERLDDVAAILKPRRRKTISHEHLEALQNGLLASSTGGANRSTATANSIEQGNARTNRILGDFES